MYLLHTANYSTPVNLSSFEKELISFELVLTKMITIIDAADEYQRSLSLHENKKERRKAKARHEEEKERDKKQRTTLERSGTSA